MEIHIAEYQALLNIKFHACDNCIKHYVGKCPYSQRIHLEACRGVKVSYLQLSTRLEKTNKNQNPSIHISKYGKMLTIGKSG